MEKGYGIFCIATAFGCINEQLRVSARPGFGYLKKHLKWVSIGVHDARSRRSALQAVG